MSTTERTRRAIAKQLRDGETFVLEFSGVADDSAFGAVQRLAEQLRASGDGRDHGAAEPLGPTFVDDPTRSGTSAFVLVDAKHTAVHQVPGLVAALADGSTEANLRLRLADGTGRFDGMASIRPVLILSAFEASDARLRDHSAVPLVAPVVIAEALDLVPDLAPSLLIGGIDIPSTPEQVLSHIHHTGGGRLWFRAAADELSVDAEVFYGGEVRVILAGARLADHDVLSACSAQLQRLARSLPGPPSGSVIRPDHSVFDAPFRGKPRSIDDARRRTTSRIAAPDDAAVGVGWSQTMSAALWQKIARDHEVIDAVELHDQRMEVTIGTIADWAPWHAETSQARALAYDIFDPVMPTRADWDPIDRAHNLRVYAERERRQREG